MLSCMDSGILVFIIIVFFIAGKNTINSAKNRWILREQDDDFAGGSKTAERRLRHTVLALHRAAISNVMSLMSASLMFFQKKRAQRVGYLIIFAVVIDFHSDGIAVYFFF